MIELKHLKTLISLRDTGFTDRHRDLVASHPVCALASD